MPLRIPGWQRRVDSVPSRGIFPLREVDPCVTCTSYRKVSFFWIGLLLGLPAATLHAQACPDARGWRVATVVGGALVLEGLAVAAFHDDWWDTPRRDFRVAWGGSASKGQDAMAHGLVGYHSAWAGARALQWACVPPKAAAWLGAGAALLVQLPKEFGDGFHTGFSASDMSWVVGGGLLQAARLTWPPARTLSFKWNYWPSQERSSGAPGRPSVFTDWAGHRFYLAFHPGAAAAGVWAWPSWLGMAVGHGVPHWVTQPPERDVYLALDINFQGLPISAPWWQRVAGLLDVVHFPAPGVRVRDGRLAVGLF